MATASPSLRIVTRRDPRRAFTLVEILLAIGIATGLLVVALTFYRQVTDLRGQVLQESERLAAIRLVLARLAADLRAARVGTAGGEEFRGSSTAISFVTGVVVPPGRGGDPTEMPGGGDGLRVTVSTVTALQGTNVAVVGLLRQEDRPGMQAPSTPSDPLLAPAEEGQPPQARDRSPEPTTEWIRFVRFRYWNGGAWQAGWTNSAPPPGVEILLGSEPQPEDGTPDDYPYEAFRRVVLVPSGVPSERPGMEATAAEGGIPIP